MISAPGSFSREDTEAIFRDPPRYPEDLADRVAAAARPPAPPPSPPPLQGRVAAGAPPIVAAPPRGPAAMQPAPLPERVAAQGGGAWFLSCKVLASVTVLAFAIFTLLPINWAVSSSNYLAPAMSVMIPAITALGAVAGLASLYFNPRRVGKYTLIPTIMIVTMTILFSLWAAGVISLHVTTVAMWCFQGAAAAGLLGMGAGYLCAKKRLC
jgi:hypothetical protein